jgi:hypothetical protein
MAESKSNLKEEIDNFLRHQHKLSPAALIGEQGKMLEFRQTL